jgi:hypothetical protein
MKWIRERDALIAQTLAFVQSVTGKKDDFRQPDTAAAPPVLAAEIVSVRALTVAFEQAQADPPPVVVPPQPLPAPRHGSAAISAARCRRASPISGGIRSGSSASVRNIVRRR